MNFIICCVYLPCLLCGLNEICRKRSAYSAVSACELLKIDAGKAVTLRVGVNEITFVHAL
jgi:hypothetical protein